MSRKGNCSDNAIAESFFKAIKVEFVYDYWFAGQDEAITSLFYWIDGIIENPKTQLWDINWKNLI